MATVYMPYHHHDRNVAVKSLRPGGESPEFIRRSAGPLLARRSAAATFLSRCTTTCRSDVSSYWSAHREAVTPDANNLHGAVCLPGWRNGPLFTHSPTQRAPYAHAPWASSIAPDALDDPEGTSAQRLSDLISASAKPCASDSLFTGTGALIATRPTMSPEQPRSGVADRVALPT